jgi:uncharacterized OB-fold protein
MSNPLVWRESKDEYRLTAQKCKYCGLVIYPMKHKICPRCGKVQDEICEVELNPRGRVVTYSIQYVPGPGAKDFAPPMILVVCDLEGGGRISGILTDCPPESVQIGMPVKMELRSFYTINGLEVYSQKFTPIRD